MDKQTIRSIGLLMFDIALVCGLIYGGWMAKISLFWYWLGTIAIIWSFVSGKALEIEIEKKRHVEIFFLYFGSLINISGLFIMGHYITLLMYVISTIAVTIFRISRSELEGIK